MRLFRRLLTGLLLLVLVLVLFLAGSIAWDSLTGGRRVEAVTNTTIDRDGGPAIGAKLYFPIAVAAAPGGAYLIADQVNNRVRRVAADGTITTVAGAGTGGVSGSNRSRGSPSRPKSAPSRFHRSKVVPQGPHRSQYGGRSTGSPSTQARNRSRALRRPLRARHGPQNA